jgi:hypothetical protein
VALEILMEKGRQSHVGQRRCQGRSRPTGVALATLGFAGSWASVGEHENQIEEEGEMDHDEEVQSPISPAPKRPGRGLGRAGARRRHGGFEEVHAWEETRERERGGGLSRGLDPSQVGT